MRASCVNVFFLSVLLVHGHVNDVEETGEHSLELTQSLNLARQELIQETCARFPPRSQLEHILVDEKSPTNPHEEGKRMMMIHLQPGFGHSHFVRTATTLRADLECEFPPKIEEDLTHMRRKRLTTETGLVCLEDYPYTVSVRLHGKHWCGGAIVGKQWVLTAAQCFDYATKEEVTVRMGSVFRDFGGRILSVVDLQRHPDYKLDQYYPEHNLAMVKVNLPISINNRMQPVALALADADMPPLFGETVVTGYGSVVSGQIREGENQELRRMIVREVPRVECRLVYGNDYHLQHDHMCLQSVVKGIALCAGDIGDPAVHFSGVNREGTLFGIALFSGTEECAYKSKPGVFAKISYSRTWIDKLIGADGIEPVDSADSMENAIPLEMN